ncbi:MAG: CarD family transcriptional regulator [Lachnospiraceae bacterium]|nr:CarD family transcriptional regulator [Lachnospiraceae bacterium]
MFEKGEYVVYGQNGICKVSEITSLDMSGIDKEKQYYVLLPLSAKGSTIYCPTDNTKLVLRNVLSKEEAWELIDEIPDIEELWIMNEKMRENDYKQAIRSGNPKELIRIIKTLYLRKQERIAVGKKMTSTDDKYFHMAEERLYSELALAIGRDAGEMEAIIKERVDMKKAVEGESQKL